MANDALSAARLETGDPTTLSATKLRTLLATGELSARELLEAHLDRIEETHGTLGAVVALTAERARREADRADALRRTRTPQPPLHGIPLFTGDPLDASALPTTWGLPRRAGHVAGADDPNVAALRAAGAIVLGKSASAQLLIGPEAASPLHGRAANPWAPLRGTGPSSEAALVAARCSSVAIGVDLAGSLRHSAHACGVHAFKPTSARLPHVVPAKPGHFPRELWWTGQPGVVARSVDDLALLLALLVRAAGGAFSTPARVRLSQLRIGFFSGADPISPAPAIRRAVREAASALEATGATVVEWTPPPARETTTGFLRLLCADGGEALERALDADRPGDHVVALLRAQQLPGMARPLVADLLALRGRWTEESALYATGALRPHERVAVLRARDHWTRRLATSLADEHLDVVLCPTTALPALPHDAPTSSWLHASPSLVFGWAGWPAGTVATTRVRPGEESDRSESRDPAVRAARETEAGSAGLPVGVQVAARPGREELVLAVMRAIESAARRRPDYPVHPPI